MTLPCTKLELTKAKAEVRTPATEHRHQRNSSTTTLPIGPQRREKEKAKHQPKERQPQRTRSLARLKWTDARQKEPVSTVEKRDIWQMNAQRKKSRPTMFASLRIQTAAKQNTKQNQMIQKNSMEKTLL